MKTTAEYKKMSLEETMKTLECNLDGLSEKEAANRIEYFGSNEIKETKKIRSSTF